MIQKVEAGRDLTAASLSELGKALPELITQGVTQVHLDASRVVEFDSATLEGLLEFDALAGSRGLSVALTDVSEVLHAALEATGLDERISVHEGSPTH